MKDVVDEVLDVVEDETGTGDVIETETNDESTCDVENELNSLSGDELKEMQRMAKEYMMKMSSDPLKNKHQYRRYGKKRTKRGAIHGGKHTGAKRELKRLFKGVAAA